MSAITIMHKNRMRFPLKGTNFDMTMFDDDNYGGRRCMADPVITDKQRELRLFMHYTDPEANGEPITVFGSAKKGLFYNYNDRLFGPDWDAGIKLANRLKLNPKTARYIEVVLKRFHRAATLDLQHIMLGVNRSNSYHYLVFGYTYTERKPRKTNAEIKRNAS